MYSFEIKRVKTAGRRVAQISDRNIHFLLYILMFSTCCLFQGSNFHFPFVMSAITIYILKETIHMIENLFVFFFLNRQFDKKTSKCQCGWRGVCVWCLLCEDVCQTTIRLLWTFGKNLDGQGQMKA